MKFNKSLIAVFAIFLVVFSACAVSATEDVNVLTDDGDDVDDDITVGDGDTDDDGTDDGDTDDDGTDDGDTDDDGTDDEEDGEDGEDAILDGPGDDVGMEVTAAGPDQSSDNQTVSSASNAQSTSSNLNNTAAGNPVLVLLAALAVLGSYSIRRK